MDQLKQYLEDKKYTVIDITKHIINRDSFVKYWNLSENKPKVIMYYTKNTINNYIFMKCSKMKSINYCIIHNHRYLFTTIDDFDNNTRVTIDKFIDSNMECDVCMRESSYLPSCPKCFYKMCIECHNTLSKQEDIFKCPQCRQEFERN
jgi:hypothetical protein